MKSVKTVLWLFLGSAGLALIAFLRPAWAFDDVRYDLSARLEPESKTISAEEILIFTNNTGRALDVVYLRIYPNHKYSKKEIRELYRYAGYFKVNLFPGGFDPGSFELKSVSRIRGGEAEGLSYSVEGKDETVLKIALDEPLPDGQALTLALSFAARIPHRYGRYGWHDNTFALNRWYPVLSVYENGQWLNHPDYLLHMPYVSDAATYRLHFRLPQDYVFVSSCDEVLRKDAFDGWQAIEASSSRPLRELSLAVSKDYRVYAIEQDGVLIRSYYFAKDEVQARKAASSAAELIRYYGRLFGAYPYKRFSIAPVYLGYGGSQNAGLIFLDSRIYEMPVFLDRYFDFLVAHETGHQWWYNLVGNDEFTDLWLDEGINSYWTLRYLDDKYGPGAKIIDMPPWLESVIPNPTFDSVRTYRWWYFSKKGLDKPVLTDISSFYEPSLIFTVAYGKGAAVVDMLSGLLGEERFARLMKRYCLEHRYKTVVLADFIRTASHEAREDLSWFFDQWLLKTGGTDYSLSRQKDHLLLRRNNDIMMPVEVKMSFRDGTEEVVSCDGKAERESIRLPYGKRLKEARADYEGKLLDVDRVDDIWPRRLHARLVPLYLSLYDVPLFVPHDAYSWITGPSFSKYGAGMKTSFQRPGDYIVSAASHYDFGSESVKSFAGFQKDNLFRTYLSWGFEVFRQDALGGEEDDLLGYKLYLRRELALAYSLFETNSHVTLYLLHNQSLGKTGFLGAREEATGLQYRQKKESIAGISYENVNAGSFPDPSFGYKWNAGQEVGGHILGGNDAFVRTSVEWDKYTEIRSGHKIALRLKGGYGSPKDKYLFYLGSDKDLRGYDYKSVQGSSMLLGTLEYRFPIMRDLDLRFPYRLFSLDGVQGVVFFDAGSAWYDRFNEPGFKKDAGFGLRFFFNAAGAAERFALRIDTAFPLDGEDKGAHVWVGINQAF